MKSYNEEAEEFRKALEEFLGTLFEETGAYKATEILNNFILKITQRRNQEMLIDLEDKNCDFTKYLRCKHILATPIWRKCQLDNEFCIFESIGVSCTCAVCDLYEEGSTEEGSTEEGSTEESSIGDRGES